MGERKEPTPPPTDQRKPDPPPSPGLDDRARYAAAFEEWLRRYNADPDAFAKEYGEPETYGEGCAEYFLKLLAETAVR